MSYRECREKNFLKQSSGPFFFFIFFFFFFFKGIEKTGRRRRHKPQAGGLADLAIKEQCWKHHFETGGLLELSGKMFLCVSFAGLGGFTQFLSNELPLIGIVFFDRR